MHVRDMYKPVKSIITERVASTTIGTPSIVSSTDYGANFSLTVHCSTGVIWVNPLASATTTNSFKMQEDQSLELKVEDKLYVLGDSTTAAYQGIVWK
jgi:hypothetical protein